MVRRPRLPGLSPSRRRWLTLTAFGLASFVSLAIILAFHLLPGRFDIQEGGVARTNVKSPVKASYVSQLLTKQEQDQAAAAVADVYDADAQIARSQQQRLAGAIERLAQLRASQTDADARRRGLRELRDLGVDDQLAADTLALSDATWARVRTEALWAFGELMRARFTQDQIPARTATIVAQLPPDLSSVERSIVTEYLRTFARPTLRLDSQATAKARQAARDGVTPVRVQVARGEMILREGDIIRPADVEKLRAVGLLDGVNWSGLAGTALLVLALVATLAAYLVFFQPATVAQPRKLLLIGVVLVGATLAAKLTVPGRELYGYLFPTAAIAMILTMLIEAPVGIVVAALFSVLLGVIGGFSFELTALGLVGSLVGVLGVWRRERLYAIFLAGLGVACTNVVMTIAFHVLGQELDVVRLGLLTFVATANGGLAALLAIGGYSVLGTLFGLTTTLGLLELAHPSQPLFRRLLTDAPGTYHHSAVVANLCERAAGLVGADPLLCRVAAYYHDIGKTLRPYCFVENQVGGDNVHDRLDPETSAQLILAHVTDGLELACQFRLPERIRDGIAQHHGTRLVSYFYHQACKRAGTTLDETPFRYAGPRPQTKEAGLMMLADTVEAMVRSSDDHSRENLAAMIDRAVTTIVSEGELDDCDLTLRDLALVRTSFLDVLASFYHPRIEYPSRTAATAPAPLTPLRVVGNE